MTDGRPPTHSAEDVLEAIDQLLEAGERDLWEGGVRPETVADELHTSASSAEDRLTALVDDGELVAVDGACPETYRPRVSYLPADHPDAQAPEY